jgi:two-component system nitrate/nitrite response regulator NarL
VTIKIILLEHHLLFAEAIKLLLESRIPDLHVEAFRSLPAALEDVASGLPIELALINHTLAATTGIESMAALLAIRPTLPIAILTDLDEPRLAAEALAQGAMGWVQKSMGAMA